jgi:DNA invertase Pin-like site-specific DNA recombinase
MKRIRIYAMIFGYAWVNQTNSPAAVAIQERALRAVGATQVSADEGSILAPRPALTAYLATLRPGDVLAVTQPSALGRSLSEFLQTTADLTKRRVGVIVLDIGGARLDTRSLAAKKALLPLVHGLAAWDVQVRRERRRAGVEAGKAVGHFRGRCASIDLAEVRRLAQTMRPAAVAQQLRISRSSVYRLLASGT